MLLRPVPTFMVVLLQTVRIHGEPGWVTDRPRFEHECIYLTRVRGIGPYLPPARYH